MPKPNWSSDAHQRVRRLLEELLSYVLEGRNDLKLKYTWEDEDSGRPKLVVEAQRRFIDHLAQFENKNDFNEAKSRLEDIEIFDDRRLHKRGTERWRFALKLWSKNKERNLQEFDRAWERQRPEKSKKLETRKEPAPTKGQVSPTTPDKVLSNIPRSGVSTDRFFGRSHELEQLHQLLQQGNRVAIAAVAGMGGVGKTELAIQYAEKYKEFYPGGICWLRAGESNLAQIVKFAQFPLGLSVPQEWGGKRLNLDQQVAWCWQHWQPLGSVLMVLDDVTNLASCQEALPPTSRFRVLVTTRKQQLDATFFELSLDVLKPVAAMQLLKSLVKRERLKREPWVARRLCKWLGYLPLGLELVGRYLAEDPDLYLVEIMERLQIQSLKDEALDLDEQQKQNNYPLMTAQRGVRAAFELSWQELDPATKNVGCLLSLLAPAVFPWKLVEFTTQLLNWAEQDVSTARRHLFKRHLIQRAGDGLYKIHSLIREFLKEKLAESYQANELKQVFAATMAAVARQIPLRLTQELIVNLSPAMTHLKEVANHFTAYLSDEDLDRLFIGLGRFYSGQGLYSQAAPFLEQCLAVTQTRFGCEHLRVATSFNNLGDNYCFQGRYSEAEPLLAQALELRQHLLGEKHCHVADSLNSLAMLYDDQGRYSEAEPLLAQALEMRQRLLGEEHPDVAESLNNLAHLYYSQSRYSEAEPLFVQSLEAEAAFTKREASRCSTEQCGTEPQQSGSNLLLPRSLRGGGTVVSASLGTA